MKKNILKLASLFCATAVAAASCTVEDADVNASSPDDGKYTVAAYAVIPQTRIYIGEKGDEGYPVKWDLNDELLVAEWYADDSFGEASAVVTAVEGDAATLKMSLNKAPVEGDGATEYYAVYPKSAWSLEEDGFPALSDMPEVQTPTNTSADPGAMYFMGSAVSKDGSIVFNFTHVAAYAKLTIAGLESGAELKKVIFTVNDTNLDADDSIEIDASNLTADESGNYTVWFSLLEQYDEVSEFDLTVETNLAGKVTKHCTFNANPISFYAGSVASFKVDMHLPVTFPVAFPTNNGTQFAKDSEESLRWKNGHVWNSAEQPQAYFHWYKPYDEPDSRTSQFLETVNSSKSGVALNTPGVKGIWTGDYLEMTLPVKDFAANTTVQIELPIYTRKAPLFWNIKYLDGGEWKCNATELSTLNNEYTREATFVLTSDVETVVTHNMKFENAIERGCLKFRLECVDGSIQGNDGKTAVERTSPNPATGAAYNAPFYFVCVAAGSPTAISFSIVE